MCSRLKKFLLPYSLGCAITSVLFLSLYSYEQRDSKIYEFRLAELLPVIIALYISTILAEKNQLRKEESKNNSEIGDNITRRDEKRCTYLFNEADYIQLTVTTNFIYAGIDPKKAEGAIFTRESSLLEGRLDRLMQMAIDNKKIENQKGEEIKDLYSDHFEYATIDYPLTDERKIKSSVAINELKNQLSIFQNGLFT